MPPRNLHIIGIDPGGTTGWARLTVPRVSVLSGQPGEILEWDYGELQGTEPSQVRSLLRIARETQSLDYGVGPALLVEAWDQDPRFKNTDPEALSPARIGAMLAFCEECYPELLGDAKLNFQSRVLAKTTMTDERLKRHGLWVPGSDHIQAAIRHAVTGLRRAKSSYAIAASFWKL